MSGKRTYLIQSHLTWCKCFGNLASYVFQRGRRLQYVLSEMLSMYSIAQTAENTSILHLEKSQTRDIGLPFSGWNWNRCFFLSQAHTYLFRRRNESFWGIYSSVLFFPLKTCVWTLLNINKSGELIRLLTFGCLVSHECITGDYPLRDNQVWCTNIMIKRMFRTKRQNTNLYWGDCYYLLIAFELFPLHHETSRTRYREVNVKLVNRSNTSRALGKWKEKKKKTLLGVIA